MLIIATKPSKDSKIKIVPNDYKDQGVDSKVYLGNSVKHDYVIDQKLYNMKCKLIFKNLYL